MQAAMVLGRIYSSKQSRG